MTKDPLLDYLRQYLEEREHVPIAERSPMIITTKEALRQAIALIRTWHGMGMSSYMEPRAWDLYQKSPEMKTLLAAVARISREEILTDALIQARDLIEGYVDVVDGDDGQPKPNKAMKAQQIIDEALNET